jgi:hypothetical protein
MARQIASLVSFATLGMDVSNTLDLGFVLRTQYIQKETMKTKLLKKLRKKFAWKCVRRDAGGFMIDEWALLYIDQSIITFHSSSERVLYSMLTCNAPEYSEFNYWNRLLHTHVNKMMRREFNRI